VSGEPKATLFEYDLKALNCHLVKCLRRKLVVGLCCFVSAFNLRSQLSGLSE